MKNFVLLAFGALTISFSACNSEAPKETVSSPDITTSTAAAAVVATDSIHHDHSHTSDGATHHHMHAHPANDTTHHE